MKAIVLTGLLLTSIACAAQTEPAPAPEPPDVFDKTETEWDTARAQLDAAKDQLKLVQRDATRKARLALAEAKIARADADDADEDFEFRTVGDRFIGNGFLGGRGPTEPLIIRTTDLTGDTQANLEEDLAVMSKILTKALGREGKDSAMGIYLSALPGGRRPQSVYLEGYGTLFFLTVKFPLVPAPAKPEQTGGKAPDSTWEQTKRELYGQKTTRNRFFNVNIGGEPVEYDADQVNELKKDLVEALKNATNIRALKPEEMITVVVTGDRGQTKPMIKQLNRAGGGKSAKTEIFLADNGVGGPRESVLTLRAKKGDIDDYAKGTIDAAEFTKRVSTAAY